MLKCCLLQVTGAFVAYDPVLRVSVPGFGEQTLNSAITAKSVAKSGCFIDGPINFTAISPTKIQFKYLLQPCEARLEFDLKVCGGHSVPLLINTIQLPYCQKGRFGSSIWGGLIRISFHSMFTPSPLSFLSESLAMGLQT